MILGGRQFGRRGGPFAARNRRAHPLAAARLRLRDHVIQISEKFRPGGCDVATMIGYVAAWHFLREDLFSLLLNVYRCTDSVKPR